MNINELRSAVAYVRDEMAAIYAAADGADLEGDALARFNEGDAFLTENIPTLEALEARDARVAELRDYAIKTPAAVVSGDGARFNVNVNTKTASDAFEVRAGSSSDELRGQAATVVEKHLPSYVTDEARENATRLIERDGTAKFNTDAVRSHIIHTSRPEYVDAFKAHLRSNGRQTDPILYERSAMSLTAANGGVLVPQFLDPTIILTNAGTNNVVRQVAGSAQITVDQWDGVTSAGVTAEWLGEGSEAADATPTFVGPTISVHKAAAWAFASFEVLMDSGFDQFPVLVQDAKDRLEESAFTTGTGSSQPYGLVTRLSGTGPSLAGSSGAAGAADLVIADLYALVSGLTPRFRRNAGFMGHITTWNQVRTLLSAATSAEGVWQDYANDIAPRLLGKPVYENEGMDSTRVSGSNDDIILFGDFGTGYKVVDRIGLEVMYEPLVKSTSNGRPTGQAGWFAFWRTGADVLTSNAFRLLRI